MALLGRSDTGRWPGPAARHQPGPVPNAGWCLQTGPSRKLEPGGALVRAAGDAGIIRHVPWPKKDRALRLTLV